VSIDPNDIIPVADLARVPAGAFDDLVGVQGGRARRFPRNSIPLSTRDEQRVRTLEVSQGSGLPGYERRDQLPALSGADQGRLAVVTNDPDSDLNGTWRWDGAQWQQAADRTTQLSLEVERNRALVFGVGSKIDLIDAGQEFYPRQDSLIHAILDESGTVFIGWTPTGRTVGAVARDIQNVRDFVTAGAEWGSEF